MSINTKNPYQIKSFDQEVDITKLSYYPKLLEIYDAVQQVHGNFAIHMAKSVEYVLGLTAVCGQLCGIGLNEIPVHMNMGTFTWNHDADNGLYVALGVNFYGTDLPSIIGFSENSKSLVSCEENSTTAKISKSIFADYKFNKGLVAKLDNLR